MGATRQHHQEASAVEAALKSRFMVGRMIPLDGHQFIVTHVSRFGLTLLPTGVPTMREIKRRKSLLGRHRKRPQ